MKVDSGLELGRDDPALELPWQAEDGNLSYQNLRANPVLIEKISEVADLPELREFLLRINAPDFFLETAKSDVWFSTDLAADEDIFAASTKLVSYVDIIFSRAEKRVLLADHEELVSNLCRLLAKAPEMAACAEFVIRHCHYHASAHPDASTDSITGFCVTAYIAGFGDSEDEARQRWSIALKLLQHAMVQAASL